MNIKGEVITLVNVGTEDDLEVLLYEYFTGLAKELGIEWAVENPWGENTVVFAGKAYEVQWQFVGLEPADYKEVPNKETGEVDYVPVGPYTWDYGGPDFEVSSYWCDE